MNYHWNTHQKRNRFNSITQSTENSELRVEDGNVENKAPKEDEMSIETRTSKDISTVYSDEIQDRIKKECEKDNVLDDHSIYQEKIIP